MEEPARGVQRLRREPCGPLAATAPQDQAQKLPGLSAEPISRGRGPPTGHVPSDILPRDRQSRMPRPRLRGTGDHEVRDETAFPSLASAGYSRRAWEGSLPQVWLLWDVDEPDSHGSPGHEDVQGHARR